jgi:hypothetical protein
MNGQPSGSRGISQCGAKIGPRILIQHKGESRSQHTPGHALSSARIIRAGVEMNIVFQGTQGYAVEVTVWLGEEAAGWFVLERTTGGTGDYVLVAKTTKAPDADEEIAHQFSLADLTDSRWQSLKLRLRVNGLRQSGDEAPLFLRVTQSGRALPAMTRLGERLNENKTGRVDLGKVKTNVPALHDFTVWF